MLKLRHSTKQGIISDFTLDKITAILALCVGAIFLILAIKSERYAAVLPLMIVAVPIFYLIFRRRLLKTEDLPKLQSSYQIRTISHIIFLISISLSVWLLWNNLYYRPPLYFVLLIIAVASIVLNVVSLEEKVSHIIVPLLKIIVLSITVYGSNYYEFYTIYGQDPLVHNAWIQGTVNTGSIDAIAGEYRLFPLFHISGATMHILTLLSIQSSIFFSVVIPMAISCTFVFLIGRKLVNTQTGLLAALIVSLASSYIGEAVGARPMSLGLCFFLVIIYLIFFREKKNGFVYGILIILLSISLILTHTVAALVTFVTLAAIFVGHKVYKRINKPAFGYAPVSLSLIAFFGIAMILRWMQSTQGDESFFNWSVSRLFTALRMHTEFVPATPSEYAGLPFLERLKSYLITITSDGGYFILLALALIGGLVYLHPQNRTRLRIAIIMIASMLFIIPYSSALLSLKDITPDRWILFSYLPLCVIAITGLFCICNLLKANASKLIVVFIAVIVIISSMATLNIGANSDSPLYFNNTNRVGYTESEVIAIKTLSDTGAGRPTTDRYYCIALPYLIDEEPFIEMLERPNEVFILRNYYLHHSEWNEEFKTEINAASAKRPSKSDEVQILAYIKEQGIDKNPLIYNNGTVLAYTMPKLD